MTNNLNYSNNTPTSKLSTPNSRADMPLYNEWLKVSGDVDDFIFFDDYKNVSEK